MSTAENLKAPGSSGRCDRCAPRSLRSLWCLTVAPSRSCLPLSVPPSTATAPRHRPPQPIALLASLRSAAVSAHGRQSRPFARFRGTFGPSLLIPHAFARLPPVGSLGRSAKPTAFNVPGFAGHAPRADCSTMDNQCHRVFNVISIQHRSNIRPVEHRAETQRIAFRWTLSRVRNCDGQPVEPSTSFTPGCA